MPTQTQLIGATAKQLDLIGKLTVEREIPADLKFELTGDTLTVKDASALIKTLFALPKRTTYTPLGHPKQPVTEKGVYRHDGTVYVVKPNKAGDRLYAKRLIETAERLTEAGTIVEIDFLYERGAIHRLSADEKLSADEAKELTIRYGRCIVCGRRLKAAKSVEAGIGPVCAGYFA